MAAHSALNLRSKLHACSINYAFRGMSGLAAPGTLAYLNHLLPVSCPVEASEVAVGVSMDPMYILPGVAYLIQKVETPS